jgi:hypothetical protein
VNRKKSGRKDGDFEARRGGKNTEWRGRNKGALPSLFPSGEFEARREGKNTEWRGRNKGALPSLFPSLPPSFSPELRGSGGGAQCCTHLFLSFSPFLLFSLPPFLSPPSRHEGATGLNVNLTQLSLVCVMTDSALSCLTPPQPNPVEPVPLAARSREQRVRG